MRKRHPTNDKLKLTYDNYFHGNEIMHREGEPMIEQYLEALDRVLQRTVEQNERTLAFRIDLRFPQTMPAQAEFIETNQVLSLFFRYFKEELKWAGTKYKTELRYVWAREQHKSDKPHYHVLMLLNYNAFNSIGTRRPGAWGDYDVNCLFHRIVRSWARAIDWPSEASGGLVELCKHPITGQPYEKCLHRLDRIGLEDAFYVSSYLCKAFSKVFNRRLHTFGSSRV